MSNKDLWQRVCKTDPAHVKPITGKQYSGNSPKPYYIVERLTEEFGLCGIGWGFHVVSERFERFGDVDSLHVALVEFWYVSGEKRGSFQQMGQTKASYMTGGGKFLLDEDAPKKSVTDALVKCASYLGFAGDIFSGRWDDSKYVNELRREFSEKKDEEKKSGSVADLKSIETGGSPMGGAGDALNAEVKAEMEELALYLVDLDGEGKTLDASTAYYALPDNDQKLYVWKLLGPHSKLRASIKANSPHKRAA